MRVAFIADIHGNDVALQAVLDDIHQHDIDRIICLGDVVTGGAQPQQALRRIQALDCPVIMGNTDSWVLSPATPEEMSAGMQRLIEMGQWCIEQLSDDDIAFIREFLPLYRFQMTDKVDVCCYHGSPQSFDDVIRATTPDDRIQPMLDGHEAALMVGGHTHQQMLRDYSGIRLVNTGSVGLPFLKQGDAHINPAFAEYALIDADNTGVHIDLRRIHLDVQQIQDVILASDMPHKEWFAAEWRAV
jgi:putative phosphoesterase